MIDIKEGETIQELVSKHSIVLLQFSSKACTPCVAIRQRIEAWLSSHEQVEARHISIDEYPELAAQNDVLSFPTVVVYIDGQVAIRESGYFSLDEIFAKLERLIELMS
ncbi:Thioredoxin [Pseudobutyrivibrio sp. C4]|uniref:thioredoxin family protein n=1 Tax=Pseudobutyrivibrio sp. C4 TaxID=1520803 RepID=UPI0008D80230|nr:thioredoxin family protein [Pseudobutyrivibrio sp. C4]SES90870.1 Thioredoxin [Pseudobutyrivibrio sp. C4]